MFVLFGVLITAWIASQALQGERATVSPRLIKDRNVIGACAFAFCLGASQFVLIYYVSREIQSF
jgi:hypothetical protein